MRPDPTCNLFVQAYQDASRKGKNEYYHKLDRWRKVVTVIAGFAIPKRPVSAFEMYTKFREFLEDESDREKLKRVARQLSLREACEEDWLKLTDWERDEFIERFKRALNHNSYIAWPMFMSKVVTNFEQLNDSLLEKLMKYYAEGGKMDEELETLFEAANKNWLNL